MASSAQIFRRCRPLSSFPASQSIREFGTLARPDSEPLVALNTMLAQDGAVLSVPAGVDAGLVLLAEHRN